MYPVVSLLRRAAIKVLFLDVSLLEERGRHYWLPATGLMRYYDPAEQKWIESRTGVPIFSFVSKATSSVGAAIALLDEENKIAKKILDDVYTLIVGRETEERVDTKIVRTFRACVVHGTWGWGKAGLEYRGAAPREQAPRRAASKNSISENR